MPHSGRRVDSVEAVFPVGGVGVMLLLIAVSGLVLALAAAVVRRWTGSAWAAVAALFVWSLVVIAVITLIPANGAPGIVPAEGRLTSCSWDIGGPAPDGFWILPGGQRLLNGVVFVPAGLLAVLVLGRWRWGWLLAPVALAGLAAYSALIELTQLVAARIDRACDVTDVVDNVTGAAVGVVLGLLVLPVVRSWLRPPATS